MGRKGFGFLGAVVPFLFFFGPSLSAQETFGQADLRILNLIVRFPPEAAGFSCVVVFDNVNDDDANDTELRILLPVGVSVLGIDVVSGSGTCSTSATIPGGTQGFVACDLGNLPPFHPDEPSYKAWRIRVRTTIPPPDKRTCGALLWSRTPDPDPKSNHRAVP